MRLDAASSLGGDPALAGPEFPEHPSTGARDWCYSLTVDFQLQTSPGMHIMLLTRMRRPDYYVFVALNLVRSIDARETQTNRKAKCAPTR